MNTPIMDLKKIQDLAQNFSVKSVLKDYAFQNKPLDFNTAYLLGVYTLVPYKKTLEGLFGQEYRVIPIQSLGALIGLHNRATYATRDAEGHFLAAEQIAGLSAAIFDYDLGLSEKGFLNPNVSFAVDNCGMGGDIRVTPNVSTVSALIAAATGIPMCKHGSPSNADGGRHGSSDFVAQFALGMSDYKGLLTLSKKQMEESIEKFNFGYTEALDKGYKVVHLQTHEYANLPHMNDILGPITNPLAKGKATKKIIGVNQLIDPVLVAEAYKIMNERGVTDVQDVIVVRGFFNGREGNNLDDGMDELSTMAGGTKFARLQNEVITSGDIYARDFGLAEARYEDIMPPRDSNGKYQKGEFSYGILKNEILGPARDMILANAALIEHIARGTNLRDAYKKMRDVLDSGAPYKNLCQLRRFLGCEAKI